MSQSGPSKLLIGAATGVGVALATAASYWLYRRWAANEPIPQKWRRVGTLQQINLFPIKSGGPLLLGANTAVACEILGVRVDDFRDRSMMLIDSEDKMITARTYPHMVLIQLQPLTATKLLITAPNMPPLELDMATLAADGPRRDIHTSVWGAKVDVMLCGEKYDTWFSRYILKDKETGLRLVYFPFPTPMKPVVTRLKREPYLLSEDTGTLNDATSYMLMNLASVNELNTRLKRPVDPLQFRGNFHLKMDKDEPYAEDNWRWMRIGDSTVFRVVAPCTRCIFPNINVDTGERDVDREPLRTLNTYRRDGKFAKYGGSPALGLHLGLRQAGSVKANDVIYIDEL